MKRIAILLLLLAVASGVFSVDRHHILNSWLEVFSPSEMGCLTPDSKYVDFDRWKEWCRASSNAGANGVRILPWAPWAYPSGAVNIESLYSPYILEAGKWNLDKWNEDYFVSLKRMVEIASTYRIKVWISLFDNCQFHHGAGAVTPWGNNLQGFRDFYASLPFSLKWVDRIVGALGSSVNYELINEGASRGNMAAAVRWNVAVFDRLIEKGIKPETIVWGALPSSIYKDGTFGQDREHDLAQQILSITERRDREQSNRVYRAMHGVGKADEIVVGEKFPASYCGEWALEWWGGAHSGKGFVSDDGVKNGNNVLDHLPNGNYQRPDASEWKKVALLFFKSDSGKIGKWAIERLPQNLDPAVWEPTLLAISEAYKAAYGIWPQNYALYPKPPPEPLPEPEPDPNPPPVEAVGLLAIIIAAIAAGFKWIKDKLKSRWTWLLLLAIVALIVLAIVIF